MTKWPCDFQASSAPAVKYYGDCEPCAGVITILMNMIARNLMYALSAHAQALFAPAQALFAHAQALFVHAQALFARTQALSAHAQALSETR